MKCKFCGNENLILLNDFYMDKNTTTTLGLHNENIRVKIEVCPNCGLGMNTTPMSSEELDNFYRHYSSCVSYYDSMLTNLFNKIKEQIPMYKKYIPSYDSKIVEIGCNDGYFLDMLQKDAANGGGHYSNLIGIEPSDEADIGIQNGLHIEKAFFTAGYFKDKVDMFFLRQVFEHLEEPFKIFEDMVSQLNDNGVIIIETPDLDVFCHIHLFYYSWPFYEKMAEKYGMKIIECNSVHINDSAHKITAIFAKKESKYKEVKCPFSIDDVINERKKDVADRLLEYYENTKLLKKFFKKHKKVYWIGTGGYSVSYLQTVLNLNLAKDIELIPVSLMYKLKGKTLPACTAKVVMPEDIQNTSADGIVVSTVYVDDVHDALKKYNISYNEIIYFKGQE